jgi:asparagine synthase (glutamine-hydrolysing)
MCRIFGHFDADANPYELRAAAAVQRHGGPDAQTVAHGKGWGLGSNRLAIMDPAHGEQPYELDDAIKVVFNGEIYNHHELRARLTGRGYQFPDVCDGSILPAVYAEYGLEFADHLDGMYAVAIVDLRAEPKLVLATDHVGMKPVYYHWDAGSRHLYFSSEIPALLSFRAIDPAPWLPGLDSYLATKTPFGQQTMFADIRVLPAATTAVLDRSTGLRFHRREFPARDNVTGEFSAAAEEVRQALDTEVHRLLEADVRVCTVTSGGLDSSLVSALAARATSDLHTFNIAYRGNWPADERGFAREVAQRCDSVHHQVEVDPATFPDFLADVVWHLGQPNADPITLSTYALFEAVRAEGFPVALTGDAADELFAGYGRVKQALRADGDWVGAYVDALAAVPRDLRTSLYSPEYRHYLETTGHADDLIAAELLEGTGSRLDVLTEFEVGQRMPAYHLRRVDHLSMAHAVEVRLPFCQPAVAGLARSLLQEHKVAGDSGKLALYEAAKPYLPHGVLNRPKQPFTLPITAMLAAGQPLLRFATEVLSADAVRAHGMLDVAAVGELLHRQAEHPNDHDAMAVWSLMIFHLWAEQFGTGSRFDLGEAHAATGALS